MSAGADIVWLRDDFRLGDQPAIHAAAKQPTLFVISMTSLAADRVLWAGLRHGASRNR